MITIVDYGVGNLSSILNMLRRIGATSNISGNPDDISAAEKLILPGVGHFNTCISRFNSSGLRDIIEKRVFIDGTPILGICVGAQMMTRRSEEGFETGLCWVNADTVKFDFTNSNNLKVPNMGWNEVKILKDSPIFGGMYDSPRFYFAHSFHFHFDDLESVVATSEYGYEFPVAFQKQNIFGTQFHPEKSHKYGLKLLEKFSHI